VILLEVTGLTILTSGFISTKIRCYLIKFLPQGGRQIAATNARASSGPGGKLPPRVLEFLRTQPGLRTDGHNVFLCHHPARRDQPMDADFGVEVSRAFESAGEVYATETPAAMAAVAVQLGAYDRMKETHDAIHAWREANNRALAGKSWEIYGDWSDDPSKLETTIMYLLK
jgi:effector-binding domain-containing protein